jgi:hypothetical protein
LFLGRNPKPSPRRSVSGDWIASLPREKFQLFESVVRRWECAYAMMSIALDEALSLRSRGELVCAAQQMEVASELLSRLGATLIGACDAMASSGRHFIHLPPVHPLDSEFFRGGTARSAASWNGLLHKVLFTDRSRFYQKLRILSETLERLVREFSETTRGITETTSLESGSLWQAADFLHYDISTCLAEAEVVLKSFLRGLPGEHLDAFSTRLDTPAARSRFRIRPRLSRASA